MSGGFRIGRRLQVSSRQDFQCRLNLFILSMMKRVPEEIVGRCGSFAPRCRSLFPGSKLHCDTTPVGPDDCSNSQSQHDDDDQPLFVITHFYYSLCPSRSVRVLLTSPPILHKKLQHPVEYKCCLSDIYQLDICCQVMKSPRSKYAMLGMLSIRPMSGYDIKKAVEGSINYFWTESYGQIYPMLKSLVAERLVTKTVKKQGGKPDWHVYKLTTHGRKQLHTWLAGAVTP